MNFNENEKKRCNETSPVRVVHPLPASSEQEPIQLQSPNLLSDILFPLTVNDFMTKHFRQNAVHIRGSCIKHSNDIEKTNGKRRKADEKDTRNRFQPIIEEGMHNLNSSELVKESSSDSIFVWLAAKNKNGNRSENSNQAGNNSPVLVQSIELPDADTALALHESTGGHALYCRAPPQVEQILVSKLLRDTGLGCGQYDPSGESMTSLARGEVEMFITSKEGGITDWHYDFQENFTLQLSGIKRWTLRRGTVTHPLRACTPHYKAPEVVENQLKAARLSAPNFVFDQPRTASKTTTLNEGYNAKGPTETVILHPGDAFYFPAGMWHKIEVIEPGISINVSLMATNYANITCQALQHLLLQKDEWRQVLVHNPSAAAASNQANDTNSLNVLEHLKVLLKKLPGIIEEFEQKRGGAHSIIPPTLINPPNFSQVEDASEGDAKKVGDTGEVTNAGEEDEEKESPAKRVKYSVRDANMESDGPNMESGEGSSGDEDEWDDVTVEKEDDEDNTINACDFQFPPGYSRPREWVTERYRLVRNPLASLIRMDDVNTYYGRLAGRVDENIAKSKNLFVLNVNYAGAESHESAVRVVLRDDPDLQHLNHLYAATDEKAVTQMCHQCLSLVDCLVYYGYYVWVPVSESRLECLSRV